MTNAQINQKFLAATDKRTRFEILKAIATHYGITPAQALEEVTSEDAYHLLDYLTEPTRSATRIVMARHGLFG